MTKQEVSTLLPQRKINKTTFIRTKGWRMKTEKLKISFHKNKGFERGDMKSSVQFRNAS